VKMIEFPGRWTGEAKLAPQNAKSLKSQGLNGHFAVVAEAKECQVFPLRQHYEGIPHLAETFPGSSYILQGTEKEGAEK
jgi:hypothetical protein